MDQAISEALAKTPGVCKMEKKSHMAVTRKKRASGNQPGNQPIRRYILMAGLFIIALGAGASNPVSAFMGTRFPNKSRS